MTTKIAVGLTLFLFSVNLKSQETTEIPLKNGIAYYSFTNKLENTKKCLSTYVQEASQKWPSKASEATTKKDKPFSGKFYTLMLTQPVKAHQFSKNCTDTFSFAGSGLFLLTLPVKIKPNNLYNFVKEKVISHNVEARMELFFTSKNEYILRIKGFTYKCITMKGYKTETLEFTLGEMYQDFLKDEKKSKQDSNMYNDINSLVNETNRIIRESLTELYKVDELD